MRSKLRSIYSLPTMNEPWRVTLFGSLRAQHGDQVITRFKTQKVASLFGYLAYHLRQAHARELMIELLWPESDTPTLRNSLSVALSSLRNQFEPPGVQIRYWMYCCLVMLWVWPQNQPTSRTSSESPNLK